MKPDACMLRDSWPGWCSTRVPLVELHISNVFAREAFRHHSYISPVARAVMCGWGVQGYVLAIDGLQHWQD